MWLRCLEVLKQANILIVVMVGVGVIFRENKAQTKRKPMYFELKM